MRSIVDELPLGRQLLVVPSFRNMRHIVNATKYSMRDLDFCLLPKTAHFAQWNSMRRVRNAAILAEESWGDLQDYLVCDFDKLVHESLWAQYLEYVIGQKGPFSGYYTSGKLQQLVQDAMRLYPKGIPRYTDSFQPSYWAGRVDYGNFPTSIFCRVFHTPLPNRYFSVERTCWVLDAMIQYITDDMLFVTITPP